MAKTLTQDQIDDLLKAIHHEPDEEEYTIKKVPSSPKIENLEIQK
jgi:flagellar motor switch protein FliM